MVKRQFIAKDAFNCCQHGIKLEQMFDRKLVLKGVVEDNIAAPKLITQWAGK